MTKARNIIFAALFLLVIFAAIEYKAADFIDVIPEALDNGEKSYIEGAPLQPLPELSFTRFMQGALQDETESYLSGCIPSRDQALLLNAAMQRVIIRTANIPFSFDAFPTFFGSSYIETLDGKRIQPIVKKQSPEFDKALEAFASSVNDFAERNTDINIVVCLVDDPRTTEANPTQKFVSSPIDEKYLNDKLYSKFSDRVTLLLPNHYSDLDEYDRHYYKTDHHWNAEGLRVGYQALATALPLRSLENTSVITYEETPFCGIESRLGLDIRDEQFISDLDIDTSSITYSNDAGPLQRGHSSEYRNNAVQDTKAAYFDGYEYYHGKKYAFNRTGNADTSTHENGRMMLITDSFGTSILPYLAMNYQNVYKIDPINHSLKSGIVQDILDKSGAKTVAILTIPNDVKVLIDKSPDIFN